MKVDCCKRPCVFGMRNESKRHRTPTYQLPVGRYSRDEVDEADVVDVVWTSKFGGELAQSPDEYDVAQWKQVEDESGESEHDDGQT